MDKSVDSFRLIRLKGVNRALAIFSIFKIRKGVFKLREKALLVYFFGVRKKWEI